ncbi:MULTISPECIES: hydrogenase maturation peptidase HycI [Rhodopseudomonas]|uniref:Hydrogenase 3 maturation protease n=1 Tax=Rhodopseudomonas palustris TaxID=1076 RepID=A0A0D7EUP8_RHOPL|nr:MULTISPECIES: hydrogenase maturation peptidase HycI [Rhodopseudomonas]KIZ43167.1 hydrogenase 3 maturation protease [Rhodopseudomonas palustris]MDF3811868.1 hydrogenase maturation peptidase HycI [Rhodopseudomonas sp. BAL398]WOK19734.1 hydrogenase maturation peptidase HycI [Rhodopseudomonas sp. BAL398]
MTGVIFTVGNSLMGDDGAGPLLAELLEANPAAGWSVIDGGATPENVMHCVRAENPDRVLLIDAADMQLPPGTVCRIEEADVAKQFLITTHAIPLDILIASLRETVPLVTFVGIQPAVVTFYGEMTPSVKAGVEGLHRSLIQETNPDDLPTVAERHEEKSVTEV